MKRLSAATLVVGALFLGSSVLGGDPNKTDQKNLTGKWEAVSRKMLGKDSPLPTGGMEITFDGEKKAKSKEGMKSEEEAVYEIDATKKPKWLTITPAKTPVLPGIYELDGDTLKISVGLPDFIEGKLTEFQRPKSFDDEKSFVITFKRVKKK